ncbi:MAG: hypothetical protein JWQ43_2951 [Glaciihabitans sp.]|nr:hypothetical protein [Glaciihabitans sp.]
MTSDGVLPDNLPEWLSTQRWYASKGSTPQIESIGGWQVERDGAVITTHYLIDHLGGRTALYQVPLSQRDTPLEGITPIDDALVSSHNVETGSHRYTYDATSDPAYAAALLELMLTGSEEPGARPDRDRVLGHRQPGAAEVEVTQAAVLRGEQSNTSIICQVAAGPPVIIKVFRALHHGENPDVTLQSAIAAAGSHLVPTSLGSLTGAWSDTGRPDGIAVGHLAFAQEFMPGVQDAWRVALGAAEAGEDFTTRAFDLGVATAQVHTILADVMPTRVATESDINDILFSMQSRLALATAEVPALEDLRSTIEEIFEAARHSAWPALQRVHGDYHLGQVLSVPDRGWVLLDFEGEPLRPMAERSALDLTLRDVAGMLRSFDYVAGTVATHGDRASAEDWANRARIAFLDGYNQSARINTDDNALLLGALEIDKALYEAVYEARNRPDWLGIPVAAIHRLAAQRQNP